jgi:hypothetical protein
MNLRAPVAAGRAGCAPTRSGHHRMSATGNAAVTWVDCPWAPRRGPHRWASHSRWGVPPEAMTVPGWWHPDALALPPAVEAVPGAAMPAWSPSSRSAPPRATTWSPALGAQQPAAGGAAGAGAAQRNKEAAAEAQPNREVAEEVAAQERAAHREELATPISCLGPKRRLGTRQIPVPHRTPVVRCLVPMSASCRGRFQRPDAGR